MRHIVFFSGGVGSFSTAMRLINQGIDVDLMFTDTLIEDRTLYKFLVECAQFIYKIDLSEELELVEQLREVFEDMEFRKKQLLKIQKSINDKVPQFHWLRFEREGVGVSPWDIFNNDNFVGNSRVANCSVVIKQNLARKYIISRWQPEEISVYLGLDWTEPQRISAPKANWEKYASAVRFPLNEEPYSMKLDRIAEIEKYGISIPKLYIQGFEHNNCGGFCVRAGKGHFKRLLATNKPLYEYHATQEAKLIEKIGVKRTILKNELSLFDLKDQIVNNKFDQEALFEIGGCGCFSQYDSDADYTAIEKWVNSQLEVCR